MASSFPSCAGRPSAKSKLLIRGSFSLCVLTPFSHCCHYRCHSLMCRRHQPGPRADAVRQRVHWIGVCAAAHRLGRLQRRALQHPGRLRGGFQRRAARRPADHTRAPAEGFGRGVGALHPPPDLPSAAGAICLAPSAALSPSHTRVLFRCLISILLSKDNPTYTYTCADT